MNAFSAWWGFTILLGLIFMVGTALEWKKLIYVDGLTVRTNVFGSTYFCLVGLHAFHVIVGLSMLSLVLLFGLMGKLTPNHTERVEVCRSMALCGCDLGRGVHCGLRDWALSSNEQSEFVRNWKDFEYGPRKCRRIQPGTRAWRRQV